MIRDANTDCIGFVFPRLIAIDYRNLVVSYIPLLEEKIELQAEHLTKNLQLVDEQKVEISLLGSNIEDERKKFEKQKNITELYEQLYKQERKLKRRWRFACGAMAVGVLAALIFE